MNNERKTNTTNNKISNSNRDRTVNNYNIAAAISDKRKRR